MIIAVRHMCPDTLDTLASELERQARDVRDTLKRFPDSSWKELDSERLRIYESEARHMRRRAKLARRAAQQE